MLPLCFEGLRHCDLASSYVFWYWSETVTPSGRAVTTCSSQTTTFWLNVTQKPKSCPNSDESCGNCNFGPLQKSSVERHSIVTRRGFRTGGLPCISSIHPALFFYALHLFALTLFANLYHFLICTLTFFGLMPFGRLHHFRLTSYF
jgi:hypothetical protein